MVDGTSCWWGIAGGLDPELGLGRRKAGPGWGHGAGTAGGRCGGGGGKG